MVEHDDDEMLIEMNSPPQVQNQDSEDRKSDGSLHENFLQELQY